MLLPQSPAQSENYFDIVLYTQKELAMLTKKEANIKAKLISKEDSLTPHMEILHKEQAYVETVLKKDPNISTLDGLVHLAVEIAIQIKSLNIVIDNWDATLKVIMVVHKNFLDKYTICV